MDDKKHFPIWHFIVVAVIVLGLESNALAPPAQNPDCSDFKALLKEGKISGAQIGADRISGTADLRGAATLLPAKTWQILPKDDLGHQAFVTARMPDLHLGREQILRVHVKPSHPGR